MITSQRDNQQDVGGGQVAASRRQVPAKAARLSAGGQAVADQVALLDNVTSKVLGEISPMLEYPSDHTVSCTLSLMTIFGGKT